ncbi:MAG: BlaI/MecI/CopY family transcriptional regulator [Planctomycetota bacterium]
MPKPEGQLTAAQFEILSIIWEQGRGGATIGEIWQVISTRRSVARTTVLNLVDRLEKRGWLRRQDGEGVQRYLAGVSRAEAERRLARGFLNDFFGDRRLQAVRSLLGTGAYDEDELRELRDLVDRALEEDGEGSARGSKARRRRGGER